MERFQSPSDWPHKNQMKAFQIVHSLQDLLRILTLQEEMNLHILPPNVEWSSKSWNFLCTLGISIRPRLSKQQHRFAKALGKQKHLWWMSTAALFGVHLNTDCEVNTHTQCLVEFHNNSKEWNQKLQSVWTCSDQWSNSDHTEPVRHTWTMWEGQFKHESSLKVNLCHMIFRFSSVSGEKNTKLNDWT